MIRDIYEFNNTKYILINKMLTFQSSAHTYLCTMQDIKTLEMERIFEEHLVKTGKATIKIEVKND